MKRNYGIFLGLSVVLLSSARLMARGELDGGIRRFELSNKLQLVVANRPELELTAVNLTVNIGSIDDPAGQAGMAHVLEHVTLQGSKTIGSLDPAAEEAALAELDRAYDALDRERRKAKPDPSALVGLQRWFEQTQQAAEATSEKGEILGGRLEEQGAIGLNATTTADVTQFFTWIPTEALELWISLEAGRLRQPIFRRFYSERNVVLREVAALTGGKPTLRELFLRELFPDAPPQPLAGDLNQISDIGRARALAYFQRYYRPDNIVIAVVGNVDPEQVHRLCVRYFEAWRADGPKDTPSPIQRTNAQTAARVRNFNGTRNPVLLMAFPQPTETAVAEVLAELINSEDLSPLYRRLVQERSLAWSVGAAANYPSQKLAPVFLVHVYGNPGVTHENLLNEATALLKSLSTYPAQDIEGSILAAERHLAAQLDDAPTLASLLARHQAVDGDWSVPFRRLEQLQRLRVEDVRTAARRLFDGKPSTGELRARGEYESFP